MVEPLLLLIDGNNLAMRQILGMADLNTKDGRPVGGLYGSIQAFGMALRQFKPSHVLWAFDHGRSAYRLDLLPSYKANRDVRQLGVPNIDTAETYKQLEVFFYHINTRWCREKNTEADDLIANAAQRFASPELPVVIMSSDHDMRQLVNENVMVYTPAQGKAPSVVYDVDRVTAKYGLPPSKLADMWSIQGDAGDNIMGVPGLGPKRSQAIIEKYGSLESAIAYEPKLEGYGRLVLRNRKLIELRGDVAKFDVELDECVFSRVKDKPGLRDFLGHFEFVHYLRELDESKFLSF